MKNKLVIMLIRTKQLWVDSFIFRVLLSIGRRCKVMKLKYIIFVLFFITVLVKIVFIRDINHYKKSSTPTPLMVVLKKPVMDKSNRTDNENKLKIPSEAEFRMNWIKNKLAKISKHSERWDINKMLNSVTLPTHPSTRIHIFYDASFRNIDVDAKWQTWEKLNLDIASNIFSEDVYFNGLFKPPDDISSNFYPLLGCYSSRDPRIINLHFKQIRDTGIGVVVVSWRPYENEEDYQNLSLLLDTAVLFKLKLAIQIEAYAGRNIETLLQNIKDISVRYTSHIGYYKIEKKGIELPVYYIFESHLISAEAWRSLLEPRGQLSVRGKSHNGVFLALLLQQHHRYDIQRSRFDGFYTYFAINGFSYGSSWKNWKALGDFAAKHKLLFFPTVGPGFVDSKSRPGNSGTTRHRSRGHYYQVAWRSAMSAAPFGVSISSFNGWADGSQLEPAVPRASYLDYEPDSPSFYLDLTRYWIKQFLEGAKSPGSQSTSHL